MRVPMNHTSDLSPVPIQLVNLLYTVHGITTYLMINQCLVLSLRRTKPGRVDEHWALHLHEPIPEGAGPKDVVKGSTHEAINDPNQEGFKKGVTPMVTDQRDAHTEVRHLTHIGEIPAGKHEEAKAVMNGVQCTKKPTEENCTDWTKNAVTALHEHGLISTEDKDKFHALHASEEAAVRAKTNQNYPKVKPAEPAEAAK
jgi:hypothetical protein